MVKRLHRIEGVQEAFGYKGRSGVYDAISKGLLPPGIKTGARAVAWPDDEIAAVQAARISGKPEDAVRALVKDLVARRAEAV